MKTDINSVNFRTAAEILKDSFTEADGHCLKCGKEDITCFGITAYCKKCAKKLDIKTDDEKLDEEKYWHYYFTDEELGGMKQ